jgi:hypothetical protein
VIIDRASPLKLPFGTRRMVEWTIVALALVMIVLVFVHKMRAIEGQTELSAIKTTLAALRTSFVLDHLRKSATSEDTAVELAQHNPFELLQRYPPNYIGEMTPEQAELAPSGSWVFDPGCVCVGYLPIWGQWFDSPSGNLMVWFRVSAAPGPFLQLTAKENYRWQGEVLN